LAKQAEAQGCPLLTAAENDWLSSGHFEHSNLEPPSCRRSRLENTKAAVVQTALPVRQAPKILTL
jgi:hypothetical protein